MSHYASFSDDIILLKGTVEIITGSCSACSLIDNYLILMRDCSDGTPNFLAVTVYDYYIKFIDMF